MSAQERVTVPEWVAAAVAGPGRVPVGQVVAGCRWPVGMSERVAGGLDTLASIAAAEYPMVCLACRTPHRIDALTEDPNPGARALDSAPCPTCGTVGLWPPTRPLREIEWSNRELWAAYGATLPLPADQVVMVPELCGRDVTQRSDHGAQPTYCGTAPTGGQAHVGAKADRPRERLVTAHAPAVVVPARPELVVVPDSAETEAAEPVPAGDAATAGQHASGPVEPAESHVEPSAAVAGELVSGEVLEGVRAELAIAARLLGDATARVTRAVAQYDHLAGALDQERRVLAQRAAEAEAEAAAVRTELAEARAAAEDAEQRRLRAVGRADELASQLTALRDGAIQKVVTGALDRFAARRTVSGERITPTQRKMIDNIGREDAPLVYRDVAGGTWHSEGRILTDGTVKTLDSLHKRGLIGWDAAEGENFAVVGLAGAAVELYSARHGHAPRVIPGVSETATEPAPSPAAEPADNAAAEVDTEPAEPGAEPAAEAEEPAVELAEVVPPVPGLAALEAQGEPPASAVTELLRRVQAGGVSRGGDRIWRFSGGVVPPRPALATLDWMLTQGMIRITDSDAVEPTTPF